MVNRALGLGLALLVTVPAWAADFCVSSAAALANALNVADNNGASDVVRLVQGEYTGNFVYNANAGETGDLRLEGGYLASCASREPDSANTILSGAGGRTLLLSGRDNSTLVVEAVTVRNGSAQLGGAGLDIDRWISVQVMDSIFSDNATVSGFDGAGGLNIDRSATVEIAGNVFARNFGGKGGGFSLSDPVDAIIDGNLVIDNDAEQNSGGIDADSAGRFVFTNNVVARNSAAEDGGGIGVKLFVDGTAGSVVMTNNTVTANSAGEEAGGVELKMIGDTTSATLHNNIVFGNASLLFGNDLFIDNDDERNGIGSPVELLNNDFAQQLPGTFIAVGFAIDPSNLNNVDPQFVDPAADDYALQAGSPLIDAGTADAAELPDTDFLGALRVGGAAPDIGAIETHDSDSDGDGFADSVDNCTLVSNPEQVDSNGDGYGNRCDADLDNDGFVNFLDLVILEAAFFTNPASAGWNPDADFNVDDGVNFGDLAIMEGAFFGTPGPSGLVP